MIIGRITSRIFNSSRGTKKVCLCTFLYRIGSVPLCRWSLILLIMFMVVKHRQQEESSKCIGDRRSRVPRSSDRCEASVKRFPKIHYYSDVASVHFYKDECRKYEEQGIKCC